MTSLTSVAEVMIPVHTPPKGEFLSRLAVTSLATGLDAGVLMIVGPTAYQCTQFSLMVPLVFSILTFAAFASLGHMWFLTIQSWKRR
jgi:hypothetical protein